MNPSHYGCLFVLHRKFFNEKTGNGSIKNEKAKDEAVEINF